MKFGNINYGCGRSAPDDWLNFDVSLSLRLERLPVFGRFLASSGERFPANVRYGNIVRGLPVPIGSAKCVFASHVLEHLTREDLCIALGNTFRMMSSGGIFRLIVPDLAALIATYNEHSAAGRSDANDFFLRTSHLGTEARPKTVRQHVRDNLGSSRHLWMWDWPSVNERLRETGFSRIRQCSFGDCADPAFASVEIEERFLWSVAAEAIKP
jgi:hypothetical protein